MEGSFTGRRGYFWGSFFIGLAIGMGRAEGVVEVFGEVFEGCFGGVSFGGWGWGGRGGGKRVCVGRGMRLMDELD
jgi:hypothetical protein